MNAETLTAMKHAMLELESQLRKHGAGKSMIARASEAVTAIEWEIKHRERRRS